MTYEEILEHLENGKSTIMVANTWFFTGRSMSCTNTSDFPCCEDYYDSFEEASREVLSFANKQDTDIELL